MTAARNGSPAGSTASASGRPAGSPASWRRRKSSAGRLRSPPDRRVKPWCRRAPTWGAASVRGPPGPGPARALPGRGRRRVDGSGAGGGGRCHPGEGAPVRAARGAQDGAPRLPEGPPPDRAAPGEGHHHVAPVGACTVARHQLGQGPGRRRRPGRRPLRQWLTDHVGDSPSRPPGAEPRSADRRDRAARSPRPCHVRCCAGAG